MIGDEYDDYQIPEDMPGYWEDAVADYDRFEEEQVWQDEMLQRYYDKFDQIPYIDEIIYPEEDQ